jgi:hypothetical protein
MAVWYSLWSLGIFFPFWYVWTEKTLATLFRQTTNKHKTTFSIQPSNTTDNQRPLKRLLSLRISPHYNTDDVIYFSMSHDVIGFPTLHRQWRRLFPQMSQALRNLNLASVLVINWYENILFVFIKQACLQHAHVVFSIC